MEKTIEVNGKEYTEEEVREAIQNFKDAWEMVVEIVQSVIGELTEAFQNIIDIIQKSKHKEERHTYYRVPLNIVPKTSQVDIPNMRIPNIRNSI